MNLSISEKKLASDLADASPTSLIPSAYINLSKETFLDFSIDCKKFFIDFSPTLSSFSKSELLRL